VTGYAELRVGVLLVSQFHNGVGDELMTLFRDDMLDIRHGWASEYFTVEKEYDLDADYEMDLVVYRAAASSIADRLDLMGVTTTAALAFLDEQLNDRRPGVDLDQSERELLAAALADNSRVILASMNSEQRARVEHGMALRDSLDSNRWLELLAAAPEGRSYDLSPEPGSRYWFLTQLRYEDYWAERHVLRAVLMAFPDAEVTLDLTELNQSERPRDRLLSMASDAAASTRRSAAVNGPVVVLTEGRTDAEFLTAGLRILYPHLTDLIRFLDYDYRPEGQGGCKFGDLHGRHTFRFGSESRLSWLCGVPPGAPAGRAAGVAGWRGCQVTAGFPFGASGVMRPRSSNGSR
jgi:HEPN/Toprim N-terminal domain 1